MKMMDPTYRPSYDRWLHECMVLMNAVKVHSRTTTRGVDFAGVRVAKGLESFVPNWINMRIAEQRSFKEASTTLYDDTIEEHIAIIRHYFETNRSFLKQLEAGDTLMHGPAANILEFLDCEKTSINFPRRDTVLVFKDMQNHTQEYLIRQAQQLQGR